VTPQQKKGSQLIADEQHSCNPDMSIINAMSVDVEDYFQVSAFEEHIHRDSWDRIPCRVVRNTERILELFSTYDVKATFFMLGWIAERYPRLVRSIVDMGHEIGSHGFEHIRVNLQDQCQFREDIIRTKSLLEDVSGTEVLGYRAASYSINSDNLWALDELQESGHRYSSSIYPIQHDHYGMPDAPRFAFYPHDKGGLLEIPISTVSLFGHRFPCGGGGYFRLFPYRLSRWAIAQVNQCDHQSAIFYFHPWEIDPEQPVQRGLPLKTRFRHYLNLGRMEKRLRMLLRDFRWGRIDEIYIKSHIR